MNVPYRVVNERDITGVNICDEAIITEKHLLFCFVSVQLCFSLISSVLLTTAHLCNMQYVQLKTILQ